MAEVIEDYTEVEKTEEELKREFEKEFRIFEDDEPDPVNDEPKTDPIKEKTLRGLEVFLGEILTDVDQRLRNKGLPAFGKISPDLLNKNVILVVEKRIPEEYLKDSPEIILITALSYIAVNNALALGEIRKNNAKKKPEND